MPALPAGLAGHAGAEWLDRYTHALLPTYGVPQRALVRGDGAYVWDADGRRYLDLLGGIATNVLGHAHPTLVGAVSAQLATLGHVSNFFASPQQVALAERLLALLEAPQGSRVFLANSGAEANEGAFKVARRTGRPRILALQGAFHGRTMGALALTHKPDYREPFAPLPGGVEHVPAGDLGALEAALDGDVAALFVEVIQGEAGVRPLPEGYLAAARELTASVGALLVVDEVQTGVGRTGHWFAHTRHGVVPDVVTVAKGLGGGIPVGAMVTLGERASGLLGAGQHGTTFGGNPVASAAALATLHVIERDGLLDNVSSVGRRLAEGAPAAGGSLVTDVRGEGLLLGLHLARPRAKELTAAALEAGFIVNAVGPDTVRLAPPLILTADQADSFLAALPQLVQTAEPDEES
ncbi:acetylornithine transaminase [Angustibacter luteus]|uniref:Acetylornithine aminotransferase n=1 Tax=Angustibacter luteus TaxID=658456 RepID=A0ABW1J8S7_9ACTN